MIIMILLEKQFFLFKGLNMNNTYLTERNLFFSGVFLFCVFPCSRADAQTYQYPFQNPALPIEQRVTNVVSLLTQAQKLSLLPETEPAIAGLGLNSFTYYTEGIHGLGWAASGTFTATQFPQGFGLGETWDTAILKQAGQEVAIELRTYNNSGKCGLVLRSPNADLARDPRWGRTEETYGEDPYLTGTLATGWIQGLRGTNPTYIRLLRCVNISLQTAMKPIERPPPQISTSGSSGNITARSFEIALMKGGAQSYMTAYNAVNGVHCIWIPYLKI